MVSVPVRFPYRLITDTWVSQALVEARVPLSWLPSGLSKQWPGYVILLLCYLLNLACTNRAASNGV